MTSRSPRNAMRVAAITLIASLFAAVVIVGEVAAQRPDCCAGKHTVALMYAKRNTGIDRLLVTGDAQAFAALAQDPSLQRPVVFGSTSEFAYRAQRPAWGYLAWIGSLGQPSLVGWVLVVLAIISSGAAVAITALLLEERAANPWYALIVLVAGMEAITELTPELAAFALFGGGLLLWCRDRRVAAVVAFCAAVAARETMLVGVIALVAWELSEHRATMVAATRRVRCLAWPFITFACWTLVVRARTGHFPTDAAANRTGLPGQGLLLALRSGTDTGLILLGIAFAVAMCIGAAFLAKHDVLTWIAGAYLLFATTLGAPVWTVHAAFTRVLVPLYGFGLIAIVGALRAQHVEAARHAEPVPVAS